MIIGDDGRVTSTEYPNGKLFATTVGQLVGRAGDSYYETRPAISGVVVSETLRQRFVREIDELETALTHLTGKLADRRRQVEKIDRFPTDDPCRDGDTLTFSKEFPGTPDKTYAFAAIRTDGLWYVTGNRSPQGITWDKLVDWMALGVDKVYRVAGSRKTKIIG